METSNVLVVEVNAAARGQLVRALAQILNRNKLLAAQSLERGVAILGGLENASIIFVSGALPNAELAEFVEHARNLPAAEKAVFVGVAKSDELDENAIAERMVVGLHSFLFEPYSAGSIEQAIMLGARVKRNGSGARLKAAAGIMLKSFLDDGETTEASSPVNLWDRVKATYDEFREVTGESLTSPVVRTLEQMGPQERAQRCLVMNNYLRKLLGKPADAEADA